MTVLRVTAPPEESVPTKSMATPAMPLSPAPKTPSLLLSSQTRPAMLELLAISAKLLPADRPATPSATLLIALGVVPGAVTLPPVLPATVRPLLVPAGCTLSVMV